MKKLSLQEWSSIYFRRPRSDRTLYLYIKGGKIYPAPIKVGREYEVEPYAILLDKNSISDSSTLMERINGQKEKSRKQRFAT